MRGGKIWGYENAHRVPCYIRWPTGGPTGGKNVDRLTAHFDLLPTLIDLCGLTKAEGVEFDGTSLRSLLQKPEASWPERTLFIHNQRVEFPIKNKEYQVLTERWRLINPYLMERGGFEGPPPPEEDRKVTRTDQIELYDIRKDPGQRTNLADRYPNVVSNLIRRYEAWWNDVSRIFGDYSAIIVGSDRENPAMLYSHDAHRKPGRQVWIVEAEKDGEYEFRTFRWQEESGKAIGETRDADRAEDIRRARLRIGNIEKEMPADPNEASIRLIVHLKSGQTCLESWFIPEGEERPVQPQAVRVTRLGPADPHAVSGYVGSDPARLLKAVAL